MIIVGVSILAAYVVSTEGITVALDVFRSLGAAQDQMAVSSLTRPQWREAVVTCSLFW